MDPIKNAIKVEDLHFELCQADLWPGSDDVIF